MSHFFSHYTRKSTLCALSLDCSVTECRQLHSPYEPSKPTYLHAKHHSHRGNMTYDLYPEFVALLYKNKQIKQNKTSMGMLCILLLLQWHVNFSFDQKEYFSQANNFLHKFMSYYNLPSISSLYSLISFQLRFSMYSKSAIYTCTV